MPSTMADESLKSHPRIRVDNVAMSHIVVGGIYLASGSQTCQEPLEMLRDYTPCLQNGTTRSSERHYPLTLFGIRYTGATKCFC